MRADSSRPLPFRLEDQARLWRKTVKTASCWDWTGRKTLTGYGQIWIQGFPHYYVHRFAWELEDGPIIGEQLVGHTCDNRACVRNDDVGYYVVRGVAYPRRGHLWLGTNLANMHDMWDKGRGFRGSLGAPPGERNGAAKLSSAEVEEIRARWAAGGVLQRELAADYGVTQPHISLIVRGLSREHA